MIVVNFSNDVFELLKLFLLNILPELRLLTTVKNQLGSFEVVFVTFFSHVLPTNQYDGYDCDIFTLLNPEFKLKRFI